MVSNRDSEGRYAQNSTDCASIIPWSEGIANN